MTLLALSCNRTEPEAFQNSQENGKNYPVVLSVGADSRSFVAQDGHSVYWDDDDRLALWAVNPLDELELNAVRFNIFGVSDNRAIFTADLGAPMQAPYYTYVAASPMPTVNAWPEATFRILQTQDGTGQGIMVSAPVVGDALRGIEDTPDGGMVKLALDQQLHLLKFRIEDPEGQLNGESVQRLELTFPQTVTGTFIKDISDGDAAPRLENGSSKLYIEPTGETLYACIFPRTWDRLEAMSAKIITETKVANVADLDLQKRAMAAGHTTAVTLRPEPAVNRCKVSIRLAANPLGEDLESITLIAPSGCKWGDNLGNVYTWYPGSGIREGDVLEFEFLNESAFRTLSGKSIAVTFDSEHVQTAQTVNIPNLDGKFAAELSLNVPPLLQENFASVGSFSSHDEYGTSSAGSFDAYSFLNGWTGGRIGASAGKCIRIACRRETSARYGARVDSAPLKGTLKKACNLLVEFSYGSNNQYSTALITSGNVGQTCYVGYVTNTKGYKSGDTDGTYTDANSFYTKEYTGSWASTPNDTYYILNNIPAGQTIRVSWRTVIEANAGLTNTTCWLYLDNIKVTIAQ